MCARKRRPSTSAPLAARPIAPWHAVKITKRNFAKRLLLGKKLSSHRCRRKLQGTPGHWKMEQIVLMTRISFLLYVKYNILIFVVISLSLKVAPDTTCPTQSPNMLCPTKALEVEDPSWLVDKNKLRSLVEFNEIRDALKDPELQKMVLKIDGSLEPEKELEKVMEGQAFQQFTNKILGIVSPQQ